MSGPHSQSMHYLVQFNKAVAVVSIFQPIISILRAVQERNTDQTQTYCKRTKLKRVWFNASFATLNKGMKCRVNVFKCGRRTEVPMEKEPQQNCSICTQKESISSSKGV